MSGLSTKTQTDVDIADVPNTPDDMTDLFKWRFGQIVYGTQARESSFYKGYIKDISKAYGRSGTLKSIYIDTDKPIKDQLKNIKRR